MKLAHLKDRKDALTAKIAEVEAQMVEESKDNEASQAAANANNGLVMNSISQLAASNQLLGQNR